MRDWDKRGSCSRIHDIRLESEVNSAYVMASAVLQGFAVAIHLIARHEAHPLVTA